MSKRIHEGGGFVGILKLFKIENKKYQEINSWQKFKHVEIFFVGSVLLEQCGFSRLELAGFWQRWKPYNWNWSSLSGCLPGEFQSEDSRNPFGNYVAIIQRNVQQRPRYCILSSIKRDEI